MIKAADIAKFLEAHKGDMPLPTGDPLDQYICRCNYDKTIRVFVGGKGIEGVMLYKIIDGNEEDSDIWDDNVPNGDTIAVHHLVATSKRAVASFALHLLRYDLPVWAERSGKTKQFTTQLLTRLAYGKISKSTAS